MTAPPDTSSYVDAIKYGFWGKRTDPEPDDDYTVSGGKPKLTDVAYFGDSYTAGGTDGLSSPDKRYSTQTSVQLKVTEHNFGVGGARQNLARPAAGPDILTAVYQATAPPSGAPYAPVWQAAVIQVSINNLNLNSVHADLSIVTSALLRAVHRLRAGGSYEALGSSRWAWTGSWQDVPTMDANTGSGIKRSFATNDVWQLTLPADFPGGTLRIYGPKTAGYGAVETFTKDGAADGSVDNRTAALQTGSQSWEHATTVTAGSHVHAGKVGALNTVENINGADFEVAQVPKVVVLNTARAPDYPGGEYTITDADVQASNAAAASALASEFPSDRSVVLVDIDALLGKQTSNFGPDHIHPNDTGAALIGQAVAAALA